MIILALLAKMIASSAILYGYYWLFLRNKKFHHYNRFYLLAATGVSIVIPFIKIPIFFEPGTTSGKIVYRSIDIISVNRWEDEIVENTTADSLSWLVTTQTALFVLYGTGVFVLLYILGRSLFYIHTLSKKYSYEYINALKLYNTTEPGTPFSFFRSIFWNSRLDLNSKEGQQIFRHELFHVKQRHSADILFLECASIFLWFNPFFHLVKREIKAIHEFLADQHSASENNQHDYAELLVLQSIRAKKSAISNYFFQTHIKRRIAMITDFKTKKYNYWTRVMVLPVCVMLFCAIALYAKMPDPAIMKKQVHEIVPRKLTESLTVLVDAGHGGQDPGAQNADGLREKDLALAIARQIKQHASLYNINIVMTRSEDNYPSLKERSEMANTAKADMIISVHLASTEQVNTNTGFDIYITNKNQQTLEQSKLLGQNIAIQIKNLYAVGPIKQRKENGIWILDAVPCQAVLIECGYITNKEDVAFISKPENQEKIAKGILEGIVRYKSAEKVINQLDTVPAEKKPKDSLDVQLNDSLKEQQIIQDKIADSKNREIRNKEQLRIQRQEMELAHRKMNEARIIERKKQQELELKHRKMNEARVIEMKNDQQILKQKQQELELKHRKMNEARVIEMENEQKVIKQKQKEIALNRKMDEARVAEIKAKERAFEEGQREIELKHRVNAARDAKMREHGRALIQKEEEIELRHRKIEEQRAAKMEVEKRIHIQKQEMEAEKRKNVEAQLDEIERKNPLPAEQEPKPKPHKPSPEKKNKKPKSPQKPEPAKNEF